MEKKTLFDISWKVSEDEYRNDSAYSYSTISRFNREGFDNLDKLFDKIETPSLTFGSMVDTLITGSEEEFNEKFEVADFPDISDKLITITKVLFDANKDTYRSIDMIPDNIISDVGIQCDYYANSKYNTYRVKSIKENCAEYYNLLFLSINKTLVSNIDYQDALACADVLKNDKATSEYFTDTPFDNVERFYQLKFKGVYENIPLRCMADLIIVNNDNKTIIPCDLKTSSKKEWNFYKSFIDWGYYIQSQLYWYIIRQNLDKDPIYKDYKLLNYRFIVINRKSLKPLVWEYNGTQSTIDNIYGTTRQYKCRNWRNLVKELHYYLTSDCKYPIGISDSINNITEWLNKE